ncbi:MAG TPA: respiratory chain complex I subunit 1 family protein [Thermaerobacter sp.]
MNGGSGIWLGLLQALFILLVAPLFTGLARILRARMHSRRGPGILQDYRDIWKLMRRQEVVPSEASWVFRVAPYVILGTTLLIAMIVPVLTVRSPLAMVGDLILVVYLFTIVRFVLAAAGLDSGSGFAGVGASREMALGVLVEPVIILVLFIVALLSGSTELGTITAKVVNGDLAYHSPSFWLAALAFAIATFIEMGKLPFDLPEAEQEIQEGPLTEYSGPSLALLKWGLGVKQLVVVALFLAVFFPFGTAVTPAPGPVVLAMVAWLAKVTAIYLIVAVLENSMARFHLYRVPIVTGLVFGLSLLSLVYYALNS